MTNTETRQADIIRKVSVGELSTRAPARLTGLTPANVVALAGLLLRADR